LIYQHLISKGLNETANTLHRETNLDSSTIMKAATTYQPFTYRNPVNVTVSKKKQNYKIVFVILTVLLNTQC